jgi:hypothetical protein
MIMNRNSIKVRDEVWIATALLHHENPERVDFTVSEIVERVEKEAIYGTLRPGVRVHAVLHCVANVPPNPARYRMLLATGRSARRLFREGDRYDPAREKGTIVPERKEIPPEYHRLLDWYFSDYAVRNKSADSKNSILALRGLGREIWADEDADSYVRRVREGWE